MKWILITLINLITFSTFAQECNWDGMGEERREQLKNILLQKAREKLDSFFIKTGIVWDWEGPIELEIINMPDGESDRTGIRIHYKFKTQRGSEISTDPVDQIGQAKKNVFNPLHFYLDIERDIEGYPIKKTCYYSFQHFYLILFNLTLENYIVGRMELFDFNDFFQFEIPLPSPLKSLIIN